MCNVKGVKCFEISKQIPCGARIASSGVESQNALTLIFHAPLTFNDPCLRGGKPTPMHRAIHMDHLVLEGCF